jgi:hypothetical protein
MGKYFLRIQALLATCFLMAIFLAYFNLEYGVSRFLGNTAELHRIASREITLLIVTTMRTSDPTNSISLNVAPV